MGDRGSLGGDELAEQAVGERQHQVDPRRLDSAPAAGQMPEQQIEANFEPRMAADRPHGVDVGGPSGRSAQERLGDLWPRTHPPAELGVEQCEPGLGEHVPDVVALEDLIGGMDVGLQQIPGADQLGRRARADLDVEGDQPIEQQQAEAGMGIGEDGAEVAFADLRVHDPDRRALSRAQPRPDIELPRQIVVGIEQIRLDGRVYRQKSSRLIPPLDHSRSPGSLGPERPR